jgi:Holliday junction resolvasome RuvABC endonuclease subunit
MKNIMAIDASLTHSGVAIIDVETGKIIDVACVITEKDSTKRKVRACDDLAERSSLIFRSLSMLKDRHNVKAVVVELPSGGSKSLAAGRAMGMAIAIISCFVEAHKTPAVWVTPSEGKKAMGGHRNASKEAIQKEAIKRYPELDLLVPNNRLGKKPGTFEHIADAVAAFEAGKGDAVITLLKNTQLIERKTPE